MARTNNRSASAAKLVISCAGNDDSVLNKGGGTMDLVFDELVGQSTVRPDHVAMASSICCIRQGNFSFRYKGF